MKIFSKFLSLFRRRRAEAEMAAELEAHLDALTERHIADGLPPTEARYAALREFGGVEQIKERCRDERRRGFLWLEQTWQDLTHAVRALGRQKGFTLVAILTLALGIGVNTALFTVFDVLTLRPLPLKDPHQLVDVHRLNDLGWHVEGFSYPEFLELRSARQGFSGFAAWFDSTMALAGDSERAASFIMHSRPGSSLVSVQFVSDDFFALLGGEIPLGRGFLPEELAETGAHPVIVLQHQFWVEQFNADPAVLGKTISLDHTAFTIIGIAAPDFAGKTPAPPIGWVPAAMFQPKQPGLSILTDRKNTRFFVFGRLRPGVSRVQAWAELQVIVARMADDNTGARRLTHVRLIDSAKFMPLPLTWKTAAILSPIWMSFLAVLIIACANVANLLLARASARQQEIGVRLALGATRLRIVRHLIAESALVAFMGGAAGLLVTTWLLHALRPAILSALPPDPKLRDWLFIGLAPDYRVFAFTFVLVAIAAVAAGLTPALLAAGADVNRSLKFGGAALTTTARPRHGLVVAQIALSLTLLAGCGVLVRHVVGYMFIDTGLQTANVYAALIRAAAPAHAGTAAPPRPTESTDATGAPPDVLETARTLPGIAGVAQAWFTPFVGRMRYTGVRLGTAEDQADVVRFNVVSPEYFAMFGLAATQGRTFSVHEADAGANVVVISQSAADRLWPHANPVGRQFEVAEVVTSGGWVDPRQARTEAAPAYAPYEVIGVVRDTKSGQVWESDGATVFLPLSPPRSTAATKALVKLEKPARLALPILQPAAWARGVSVEVHEPLDYWRDVQLLPFKATAAVGACLAALALGLAAVGLYGVMSFAVNQRVREIGIRIALGATSTRVVALFVRQGLRVAVIGIAVGAIGAVLVPLTLPKAIVGVRPFEPLSLMAVLTLLVGAAWLASWLPARRATQVNPVAALRTE